MLSIETEARLAKLLLSLSEYERNVEISREVLSDNKDFDPYQIFLYLDYQNKNNIDIIDIMNFLRSRMVYFKEEEIYFILLSYDNDGDGYLSYNEFVNLIKSEKSFRKTQNFNSEKQISFNVEFSLQKVFEKEIELARNTIYLLEDLRERDDYDPNNIFNVLKSCYNINEESIREFLDRTCTPFLDNDIKSIMKRLDFNHDFVIDSSEFFKFIEFPNSISSKLINKEKEKKYYYSLKNCCGNNSFQKNDFI